MTLTCTMKEGSKRDVRVPIDPPLSGYEDVKPRLLEMKALAQEGLGMVRYYLLPYNLSFELQTDQSSQNHFLWASNKICLHLWIRLHYHSLPSLHPKTLRTIIFHSQCPPCCAILPKIHRLVYSRDSLPGISLHFLPLLETLNWFLRRGEFIV